MNEIPSHEEWIEKVKDLQQTLDFYRTLIENTQDLIYRTDLEGRISFISPSVHSLLGYTIEEAIGMNMAEEVYLYPEEQNDLLAELRNEGRVTNFETRLKQKDGSIWWASTNAHFYKDLSGNILGVEGITRDISEINRSESSYRSIFNAANDAIFVHEMETGRILDANNRMCEMYGYTREEVGRLNVEDLSSGVSPYTQEDAIKWIQKAIDGDPQLFEWMAKDKSGRLFWTEVNLKRVKIENRGRLLAIVRDITERKQAEKAQREILQRLEFALQGGNLGMWDWNPQDGAVVYSNLWAQMLEYRPNEVEPTVEFFKQHVHPEDLSAVLDRLTGHVEGRLPAYESEHRIRTKSGRWLWVLDRGKIAERDKDGRPARVTGLIADITERKEAEEALRESEERFRLIAENTSDSIWIMDTALQFTYLSPSTEQLFGYTLQEWQSLDWGMFVHPDDIGLVRQCFNNLLQRERPTARQVIRVRKKDACELWVDFSATAVFDQDGNISSIVGVTRDITQLKQSELALLESETRFKALHNASFGGIAIHDQGVILECNQGLSEMTGYEYSELIGMNGLLLISEKSRQKVINNIRSGYEKPYEAFGLRKNGEEFPMRLEARNVPYKGKQVRTVEFRDLTEQKQAEAEKEKLQARLSQAQKMESVGRLAGGVAHDFNNMLNIILGNTEMAMEDMAPDDPLQDILGEIFSAAKRSADITRQLLAFSRKQIIAPKVLDFNATIESMLKMLRRLIGEDIDLAWLPGANIRQVSMDPSQIDQILANLCVNARDAIADVGKITIETGNTAFDSAYCETHPGFKPGDFVLLAVSDNGCGMDQETLANLFEPFFSTKDVGEGTGLGLATVYGIVKQNDGFINVYSEPDQGTTFRIYLPRYQAETEIPEKKTADKTDMDGNETILLVEDEPPILRMTRMMLERMGYKVLAAGTPGEAIALAREHAGEIHMLMTDVVMPEMNGRDLAKNLLSLYPNLKRLFMSGYTANVIAHHCVLDKGVQFLQKPFSKQDLATKVREALDDDKR